MLIKLMVFVSRNVQMVHSHMKLRIKSIIVSNVIHYALHVVVLHLMIVLHVLKVLDLVVKNVLRHVLIYNTILMVNVHFAKLLVYNVQMRTYANPVLKIST